MAVTAGYIHAQPRREFYAKIDAANVDLKAFTEKFYHELTSSHLGPVKETLEYLVHETNVWTEITTLLIPGMNDSTEELEKLTAWVAEKLGPHVPLHFSAFHPDYKMAGVPATPPATLQRARSIALKAGLKYVYTGNVHDPGGEVTSCESCGTALIERDWYELLAYRVDAEGKCPTCAHPLHGRFDAKAGSFGRRRFRIAVGG